jgi:peptidyl-prolyl cis-trans isomerase B (cyclophilin B)
MHSWYKLLIPLFALALLIGCVPTTPPSDDGMPPTDEQMMDEPPAQEETEEPIGFDGQLLSGMHEVILHTSMGDIRLELDADKAPKAVTNFVVLSQIGYFNGLTFHRVIPGFMVQGGDPNGNGTGGSSIFGESFEDEQNDLQMSRGAIAMANRGPNTNGSQFFIVQAEATPWLQGRHTIFGRVTEGMEVVDAIAGVERNESDMPLAPITYDVEVVQ